MKNPAAKKIAYWSSTVIVALLMMSGGVGQVTLQNAEGFTRLGYPVFFMVLLGVWKLLGGVALLVPRFPRVKEWAYAGIFFDLSGAVALRPESRTLGTMFPART